MGMVTYETVLTVAGSDSSGGAGIQADLKTFAALGCYGMSVITALTAQNTRGVSAIHAVPLNFIDAQIQAVFSDIKPNAVKTGMLLSADIIELVARLLTHYAPRLVDGSRDTWLHGMTNADDFLSVCADLPRGAILCGHSHHGFLLELPGVAPPIVCSGSSTMSRRETIWVFDVGEERASATRGGWDGEGYRLDPSSTVELP